MNPLSIQHAFINQLELNKQALQPTIEVACEWGGRTVKKHVLDTGNRLLNKLVTGEINEPAVKPALEILLGRAITHAEEKNSEAIIRTIVQKCISESDSSGIESLSPSSFAEKSADDHVFSFDSELSSMASFKAEDLSSAISEQTAAQYIEPLIIPTLDELKLTRQDKRDTGNAFTRVAMVPAHKDVAASTALLLNTLPDEVLNFLDHLGWDISKTEELPIKNKKNLMSKQAINRLTGSTMAINTPSKGRYLGAGTYGTVKFAVVTLNDGKELKSKICVAKKMHISPILDMVVKEAREEGRDKEEIEADLEDAIAYEVEKMRQEIAIQNHAGANISPVIHGYSHTLNKNNEDLLIVFMEPAAGIDGQSFFEKNNRYTIAEKRQLLLNLLETAKELQNKDIFHNDYKWNNCSFNPETLKSWILDFGLATTKKITDRYHPTVSCFYPPEITEKHKKDAAKIDVYQLGIMLTQILRTDKLQDENPFFYHQDNPFFQKEPNLLTHWSHDQPLEDIQEDLDIKLGLMTFPNQSSKQLIRDMITADPSERLTLDEAIRRFKNIRWLPDTPNKKEA